MEQFFMHFVGILFFGPVTDALKSCTHNAPTGGIYDKYCWFGQYCCNKATKLCCSDGEICTGSSCINLGGLVGGCVVVGVVFIGVFIAMVIVTLNKKKKQTGLVVNQTHTVQPHQPGQVTTVTTINQGAQGYPPPTYNSNNAMPGLHNNNAQPGLNNGNALPGLNNGNALPGINNGNALPGLNNTNPGTGYNNPGFNNTSTVYTGNTAPAGVEPPPQPIYPHYLPNSTMQQ